LTALFTFQDQSDAYHAPREESSSNETRAPLLGPRKSSALLPVIPPRPEPKAGVERIAEMQAFKGEVNEVAVEDEGEIDDYAQHCWNLLKVCYMLLTEEYAYGFVLGRCNVVHHYSIIFSCERSKSATDCRENEEDQAQSWFVIFCCV
jgi:hypothetical protein